MIKLNCPFCSKREIRVLESREVNESRIRRRRECSTCGGRFTTYETVQAVYPRVIKKDGKLESFDRDKI